MVNPSAPPPFDPAEPLATALPPPLRLAVAYAPPAARELWSGLLMLDLRLEQAALGPREALIGQLKLAWWRDRFAAPAGEWPSGEPLLRALRPWDAERAALSGLVDGWEGLVGGEGGAVELGALADARGAAIAALARLAGCPQAGEAARTVGREWALADLAVRLGRREAIALLTADRHGAQRLPRVLRPLAVLRELAGGGLGLARFAKIVRLGLLGR